MIIGTCDTRMRILCTCFIVSKLITSGCSIASKAIMTVGVAVSV